MRCGHHNVSFCPPTSSYTRHDIDTYSRTVFSLVIINKAGGLIYNRTFHEGGLNKISTNDYLVLAGTFHGYANILLTYHKFNLFRTMLTRPFPTKKRSRNHSPSKPRQVRSGAASI